ncbi:MAG TPA: cupredoxin domain-containing protein [Rhizomicrobium sp.]|nr:cupredoxin domain-containing protein [Rhizomicrobium sp.]
MKKFLMVFLPAAAAIPLAITPASADVPVEVHLKNHKFSPSVIKVKANKPSMITLYNDDGSADEFDSPSLKIERVVPGRAKANIRIRALAPGKYPFMGEFNAATAQGVVIAE